LIHHLIIGYYVSTLKNRPVGGIRSPRRNEIYATRTKAITIQGNYIKRDLTVIKGELTEKCQALTYCTAYRRGETFSSV
jgi:hypothetical protein